MDEVIDHAVLIHHGEVQQQLRVVAGLFNQRREDLVQSVALLDKEQSEQLVQRIFIFQPQDSLCLLYTSFTNSVYS